MMIILLSTENIAGWMNNNWCEVMWVHGGPRNEVATPK